MTDLAGLFDDLIRYETLLYNAVDARLRADRGHSIGVYEVAAVIARTPDCRVHDVARALVITVGAASKAVDRLEAQGLCDRRPHPEDRRSSIVTLTGSGEELRRAAAATFDDELRRRFGAVLTPDRLAALADTLRTLRASF